MVTASEARLNVTNFEKDQYNKVMKLAEETLEAMSKSIELHSKNGYSSAEFVPYDRSRFETYQEMRIASEIFQKVFTGVGFEVLQNDWTNNIIKIKW